MAQRHLDRKPRTPSAFGSSCESSETLKDAIKEVTGWTKATWSPYILSGRTPQNIPGIGTGVRSQKITLHGSTPSSSR